MFTADSLDDPEIREPAESIKKRGALLDSL
jgi:hypothetical protein